MIILRNKEYSACGIAELFDTATEFKGYVFKALKGMDEGMRVDGIFNKDEGVCGHIKLEDACFGLQLNTFLEVTESTIEVK
jgi:hypothetical protein